MTDLFYAVVKASLHASDASVFGLKPEEIKALVSRYPGSSKEVVNGILIQANPLQVINSLGELGFRVVCSSGESDIVWTLKREALVDHLPVAGKETQGAKRSRVDSKSPSKSPKRKTSFGPSVAGLASPSTLSTTQDTMNPNLPRSRGTRPVASSSISQQMIMDDSSQVGSNVSSQHYINSSQQIVDSSQRMVGSSQHMMGSSQYMMGSSQHMMGAPPNIMREDVKCKIGGRPEDFQEFGPRASSRIYIRNPESFDQGCETEGVRVILRTNECSPNNPLARVVPVNCGPSGSYSQQIQYPSQQQVVVCPPQQLSSSYKLPPTVSRTGPKPIWYYAMIGEVGIVSELISKGCDVNEPDPSGYTALHYAAKNGNLDICDKLIKAGACVNMQTQAGLATALHRAAGAGKIDVCKLLLKNRAETLVKDIDGRTALHRAVEGGHEGATTLLLDHGVEALCVRDNRGCTPYDLAKDDSLRALIARIAPQAASPSTKYR